MISCRCVHQSREPVVSSAQAVMREREKVKQKHMRPCWVLYEKVPEPELCTVPGSVG